ncbi:hypothetical protein SAMN06296386_11067 [Lachnospiraceae bacterium]|nr:hypothetical protein SAMN06296386_11067 [Lachnospiraceae bacterium]
MRSYLKANLLSQLNDLSHIQKKINDLTEEDAQFVLSECQNAAIQIGTLIENNEGEGTETVHLLEEYCELLYLVNERIASDRIIDCDGVEKLDNKLTDIFNRLTAEIPGRNLVVFLPYKASMWDSLETVWEKERHDPDNEVMVVSIPYYDKNPDGTLGLIHDEQDLYPKNVTVADWKQVDLEALHPDRIYIHNPYDEGNKVTSVEPRFYAKVLKRQTEELIYIPYFVLKEPDLESEDDLENLQPFVMTSGVIQASKVIVQSEDMKKAYIKILSEKAPGVPKAVWERKIEGTGSPKVERLLKLKETDIDIPEEWKTVIYKGDGSKKVIVLYNNSINALLDAGMEMIKKIERVLQIFYEERERVALLWRPHPLLKATIQSMKPELREAYDKIVTRYRIEGWGIYDESPDMTAAMVLSDAYYGDLSSLVWLYQKLEKPIMIENVEVE